MDLEIEGRHALLFDDDANAAFVNSRAALVPWTGDESVLIDRYDVRHLLDRIPPRPKKQRFVEETGGVSQTELDSERFLDLPLNDDDEGGDERGSSRSYARYRKVHPFSIIIMFVVLIFLTCWDDSLLCRTLGQDNLSSIVSESCETVRLKLHCALFFI